MSVDPAPWPLWLVSAGLAGAALVICLAGTRLARLADTLADRTGMGEIIAGALFVGASTSLPGVITSITTAAQNYPGLAIGNALGGLTAQTTFLAVADLGYRKANFEHAAASVTGLTQGTLLVSLLALPLLAMARPSSPSSACTRSRCCCSSAMASACACSPRSRISRCGRPSRPGRPRTRRSRLRQPVPTSAAPAGCGGPFCSMPRSPRSAVMPWARARPRWSS
jgi:hypothetical protein